MLRVLVLGGYGFFGSRIAEALARDARIRLIIGGRDREKAIAKARALGLPSERAVALDAHDATCAARVRALGVDVLVHTAGPFQGQRNEVAEAALEAGAHYIDIADGRAFVAGITALDERARRAGLSVVSGASSIPALSSAVVDHYAPRFAELDAIRVGIASGARAPGLATVRGIFGYLGKPFVRIDNGVPTTTYGWMDLQRHRFPAPLGQRLMGSCDVPDLELFPQRYAGVRTVTFHAGFASSVGHLAVYGVAALVRAGLVPSGAAFAAPLSRLARTLEPLISHRGGMFVTLEGTDHDGAPLTLTWHLLAAQNHGPQIPCGAAIALVRKLAAGQRLPAGAMPCIGLLTVDEYLEPLRGLDIREVAP